MKKFILTLFALLLLAGASCQEKQAPKQYFSQAPEIEIAKKAINSYLNQDWETYRSCYSDTARIWQNVWWTSDPGISIEEEIKGTKEFISSIVSYTYEDTIWEMIVNDEGDKWVHFWGKWVGKVAEDGDEIEVVVHVAFGVYDDKIVYEAGVWDNLPMYLVQQAEEKKDK